MSITPPSSEVNHVWMRHLVWTFFILWIFEGALRKWVLPSLSDALLLIRDPFVLALYGFALREGIFPRNIWLLGVGIFSVLCLLVGILVLPEGVGVVLYGYRTNFMYLPMIFLIPRILDRNDLHRIGKVLLLLSVPQALLMAAQFVSPPDSWLNAGAGGNEAGQIGSAMGHIRPSGTFSFTTGVCQFYMLVTAFLLYSRLSLRRPYAAPLTILASTGLVSAAVVSGSRTFLLYISIVIIGGSLIAILSGPKACAKMLRALVLLMGAVYVSSYLPFFSEGVQTFAVRLEQTGDTTDFGQGSLQRAGSYLLAPINQWNEAPAFGYGLGAASNVGTKLLGRTTLSLGEAEWDRILSELGPILGVCYLMFRLSVLGTLFRTAVCSIRRERDSLCFLLLFAVLPDFAMGSWGLSSTLGYAVFTAGCALAGANQGPRPEDPSVTPNLQSRVSSTVFKKALL